MLYQLIEAFKKSHSLTLSIKSIGFRHYSHSFTSINSFLVLLIFRKFYSLYLICEYLLGILVLKIDFITFPKSEKVKMNSLVSEITS